MVVDNNGVSRGVVRYEQDTTGDVYTGPEGIDTGPSTKIYHSFKQVDDKPVLWCPGAPGEPNMFSMDGGETWESTDWHPYTPINVSPGSSSGHEFVVYQA